MMKRALSMLLALALTCGLGANALAAEATTEQQLAAVTLKVKNTLEIGDSYTGFQGVPVTEGPISYWRLEWSGEDGGLEVEADANGKIMSYAQRRDDAYAPETPLAFPKLDRAAAQEKAQVFLKKVLAQSETAVFTQDSGAAPLRMDSQSFSGRIQLNGLPSPIGFRISIRTADGGVERFYRDDLYTAYLGGVPAAKASTGQAEAAQALKGTLSMRLEYVLDEGSKQAVLRYLPSQTDKFYVDAQTGALVNLSELEERLRDGGAGGAEKNYASGETADTAAPMEGGLSQAEQAGISKLEGVLSQAALEKAVRAVRELKLSGYTVGSFRYALNGDTGEVTASLRFREGTDKDAPADAASPRDANRYRTVVVNARTGALKSVSGGGNAYDPDRVPAITEAAARSAAEDFLKAHWAGLFANTALYEQSASIPGGQYEFRFAQKANDYFFTGNAFEVTVDMEDGSICGLYYDYDSAVTFDGAEGVLPLETAVDAWFQTFTTPLAYLEVPVKLNPDSPVDRLYLDAGVSYCYSLKLGYALAAGENGYVGIDAKTGKPVEARWVRESGAISYQDLDGCWAKAQIEALAAYGVGYQGGSFQPDRELTQLDLVALLASAGGYYYEPAEEGSADELYRYAYRTGLLTAAERSDGALLSRAETVKLLLDYGGYGPAARLRGIFRCSFRDEAQIPEAYYGYAAIAQGLGVVNGDAEGNFAPNRTATRLEAAVMLYQFMSR